VDPRGVVDGGTHHVANSSQRRNTCSLRTPLGDAQTSHPGGGKGSRRRDRPPGARCRPTVRGRARVSGHCRCPASIRIQAEAPCQRPTVPRRVRLSGLSRPDVAAQRQSESGRGPLASGRQPPQTYLQAASQVSILIVAGNHPDCRATVVRRSGEGRGGQGGAVSVPQSAWCAGRGAELPWRRLQVLGRFSSSLARISYARNGCLSGIRRCGARSDRRSRRTERGAADASRRKPLPGSRGCRPGLP